MSIIKSAAEYYNFRRRLFQLRSDDISPLSPLLFVVIVIVIIVGVVIIIHTLTL